MNLKKLKFIKSADSRSTTAAMTARRCQLTKVKPQMDIGLVHQWVGLGSDYKLYFYLVNIGTWQKLICVDYLHVTWTDITDVKLFDNVAL